MGMLRIHVHRDTQPTAFGLLPKEIIREAIRGEGRECAGNNQD
jgi:hypothetical protein